MNLIPAIQLQNGHCVTLHKGRVEEPSVWHVDPVETAKGYATAGAEWIHLTDLNAVTGDGANTALVDEIIKTCGTAVQIGGGFTTMDHIAQAVDQGAGRIVIGSAAVTNPEFLREAAKYYPDQIVLAVDVYQGKVSVDGWRQVTAFEPADFIAEFAAAPLAAVMVTDVHSEIGDPDSSMGLVSGLAEAVRAPVIAGGLVHSLDDVARLKYTPAIGAAVIGRPLFEKTVDLKEALVVAAPDARETVAKFV
ncbi:MAG: 1-(5-phosphoribosyl)-5-[(5-phosphoribosylamino)methylideneamino] imidazole-4-carboxamide isomerase [Paracoccaceae bacterium]